MSLILTLPTIFTDIAKFAADQAEDDFYAGRPSNPHYDDGDHKRLLPALPAKLAVLYPAAMVDGTDDATMTLFMDLIETAETEYADRYSALDNPPRPPRWYEDDD